MITIRCLLFLISQKLSMIVIARPLNDENGNYQKRNEIPTCSLKLNEKKNHKRKLD